MKTILLTAAALLAAWCGLAVLLGPPIGRMLKRSADAEILAPIGEDEPTADLAALTCPDWCPSDHPPGAHCRTVGTLETPTAWLEVELAWWTPLSGPPVGEPEVHLVVLGADNNETVMTLTPPEAGTLAVMVATADGARLSGAIGAALAGEAGWLAEVLAQAATLAGYAPCSECGSTSETRQEYDRGGRLVWLCAGCHLDLTAGVQ